jgi:hypothetical protein
MIGAKIGRGLEMIVDGVAPSPPTVTQITLLKSGFCKDWAGSRPREPGPDFSPHPPTPNEVGADIMSLVRQPIINTYHSAMTTLLPCHGWLGPVQCVAHDCACAGPPA